MVEAGLVNKWKNDQVKKVAGRGPGEGAGGGGEQVTGVLTIAHLQGAFFLYVLGGLAALVALGAELVVARVCRGATTQPEDEYRD